jgi:ketosteroid isomerase-like protein
MPKDSMSAEIELVRRFNKVYVTRDPGAFDLLTEDFVYRPIATFTESGEHRGRDAFRRFTSDWWETWDDGATWELESIRRFGDSLVALLRFRGRARASGFETVGGVFQVFRFREGAIASIEDFTDKDEAIAVAEGTT